MDDLRTPQTAARRTPIMRAAALVLPGAAISAYALWQFPFPAAMFSRPTLGWKALAASFGFLLRTFRRYYLLRSVSFHKHFSFEMIFQAAVILHPQLSYPAVEREFLALHGAIPARRLNAWFGNRATSAVTIPLMLLATVLAMANQQSYLVAAAAAAGWATWRMRAAEDTESRSRLPFAQLLGWLAMLAEGYCFVQAVGIVSPDSLLWARWLTYAVTLTIFELSPIPLAAGLLEGGVALLPALFRGVVMPSVWLAFAYRLWRAVPAILLFWFYLPRYKMRPRDLWHPALSRVLHAITKGPQAVEPAGGPLLSIILPAYNEAERLPRYLPEVLQYGASLTGGAEIIVVDDGSKDGTAAYVESLQPAHPALRLIRQVPNQGKGAAVRRGVAESHGAYVLFADADGATPITEATKLLSAALEGSEVAIGSRKAQGTGVQRDRSFLRELTGTVFYRITNLLAVPDVQDTQCGFKLFRRDAARNIFSRLSETGWAFDVEALFWAQRLGYQIEEVPVNWTAIEGSKVRSSDAFKMIFALLRIRRRDAGITGERET